MTPSHLAAPAAVLDRAAPGGGEAALAAAVQAVARGEGSPTVQLHLATGQPAGSVPAGGGSPVLTVRVELATVTVGPLTVPGEPGCATCVRRREEAARAAGPPADRAWAVAVAQGQVLLAPPPVTAAAVAAVAAVAEVECAALRRGARPRTRDSLVELELSTLAVRVRRFLPDPLCPDCGQLPDDSPAAGRLELVSRPTTAQNRYRVRDLVAEYDRLVESYVDSRCGVIPALAGAESGSLVMVAAFAGIPGSDLVGDGYGRTPDYPTSAVVGMAEALERLGGLRARARATVVRASFAELGPDRALDPVALGLPGHGTPGAPATAGGPVSDYHPELPLDWVYAYSFRRDAPLLVPVEFAYYGEHGGHLAFECSNGCALGGCLEEAVLYGIFEVAERDAFLVTWYARLPLPQLDPRTSTDPANRMLVEQVERASGCRLYVFDATMPEGVPAVMLALVDERDRGDVPKVQFSAGAHLDPERALRGGLLELASTYDLAAADLRRDPDRAARLVANPELMTTMEDHGPAYACATSWPRLSFLFPPEPARSMAEAFPPATRYAPAGDLRTDLHRLVRRYLDEDLDVLVVDQTAGEHRAAGLHCVKVLIPGTLPMTFGHQHRRTDGLPRLRTAPVRLGYRSDPLPEGEINPFPHPFP